MLLRFSEIHTFHQSNGFSSCSGVQGNNPLMYTSTLWWSDALVPVDIVCMCCLTANMNAESLDGEAWMLTTS